MKSQRYLDLCDKVARLDTSIAALEDDREKAEREMEQIEAAHIQETFEDSDPLAVSTRVCSSENNPLVFCVYDELVWPLVCKHCDMEL